MWRDLFSQPGNCRLVRARARVCVLIFRCKRAPCYLGGSAPPWRPHRHIHAHSRCVGVTKGTDGREQRLDLLRHLCLETPVTGVDCTRKKPGLGATGECRGWCTWRGWQVYIMIELCCVYSCRKKNLLLEVFENKTVVRDVGTQTLKSIL